MDRLSLRKQRQRWQRSRKPSFSLRQEGRFSERKFSQPQIEKYVGVENGQHFTAQSSNLTVVGAGALRTEDIVLVWGDRLIGPSRGRQIF